MVSRQIGRYFWLLSLSAAVPVGVLVAVALSSDYVAGAWSSVAATVLFICIATPFLTFLKVRDLATLWNCVLVAAIVGAVVACLDPLFAQLREASSPATSGVPGGVAVLDRPPETPIHVFGVIMLALLYSAAGAIFWFVTRRESTSVVPARDYRESGPFLIALSAVYWVILFVVLVVLMSEVTHNLFGWPGIADLMGIRA